MACVLVAYTKCKDAIETHGYGMTLGIDDSEHSHSTEGPLVKHLDREGLTKLFCN